MAGTSNELEGQTSVEACRPCAAGTHGPYPMLAQCVPCARGTFMARTGSSDISCTPCPVHHFQPLEGQSSSSACRPCPAGSFSDPGTAFLSGCGAPATLVCPVGEVLSSNGSVCVPTVCGAGRYSTAGGGASEQAGCAPCAAGTFGGGGNVSSCRPCPAGAANKPCVSVCVCGCV